MKFSKNNITLAILGFVFGFLIAAVGQLIECGSIDMNEPVNVCSDGTRVSYIWSITSYLAMAIGVYAWIYRNNDGFKDEN